MAIFFHIMAAEARNLIVPSEGRDWYKIMMQRLYVLKLRIGKFSFS